MEKIKEETLRECADRLMFDMSDAQYQMLEKEFEIVIKQMELIGKNTELAMLEPMTFPFAISCTYLREDIPEDPLTREDVLKNVKDALDGQIKLPKVVN